MLTNWCVMERNVGHDWDLDCTCDFGYRLVLMGKREERKTLRGLRGGEEGNVDNVLCRIDSGGDEKT
jgi:hypothetical protein